MSEELDTDTNEPIVEDVFEEQEEIVEGVEEPVQKTTVGMKHAYINLSQQEPPIIASWDADGQVVISHDGEDEFRAIVNSGDYIASYRMDTKTPTAAELLEQERARMLVSKFQAKAALLQSGLLDSTREAIENADAMTQLAWSDAQEFRRSSPMISTLAVALGLTEIQVDDLFKVAATIEA